MNTPQILHIRLSKLNMSDLQNQKNIQNQYSEMNAVSN